MARLLEQNRFSLANKLKSLMPKDRLVEIKRAFDESVESGNTVVAADYYEYLKLAIYDERLSEFIRVRPGGDEYFEESHGGSGSISMSSTTLGITIPMVIQEIWKSLEAGKETVLSLHLRKMILKDLNAVKDPFYVTEFLLDASHTSKEALALYEAAMRDALEGLHRVNFKELARGIKGYSKTLPEIRKCLLKTLCIALMRTFSYEELEAVQFPRA